MLFRILRKNKITWKSVIGKIVFYFFIWFFFVYIIYSLLFELMAKYEFLDIYNYCNYDIVANSIYKEYYGQLEHENDFLKYSLKGYMVGGNIYDNKDHRWMTTTLKIDSHNFDILFRFISKKHFISIDSNLLNSRDCVLIQSSLAKNMGAKIGDYYKFSDKSKQIAGIYEDALRTVFKADSIMLWDGIYTNGTNKSEIETGKVDYFDVYSYVYIQFDDYNKGVDFFKKNHLKQEFLLSDFSGTDSFQEYLNLYGKNWPQQLITETIQKTELGDPTLDEYKRNAFFEKKVLYALAKNDFDHLYNLDNALFYSGVCIIALFSVCILESYRHAKKNEAKVAVLRILGYNRFYIQLFYFLRSVFIQIIFMVLAITFAKVMTYKTKDISSVLITKWFFIFCIVIVISAFLSTLFSMRRLKDDKLLKKLNEEGK